MRRIQILGTGCPKCRRLAETVERPPAERCMSSAYRLLLNAVRSTSAQGPQRKDSPP